jgi:hypothetical protein
MKQTIKDIAKKAGKPESECITRGDGRVEWVCKHGVGHTIYNPNDWGAFAMVHGCDGCCGTNVYVDVLPIEEEPMVAEQKMTAELEMAWKYHDEFYAYSEQFDDNIPSELAKALAIKAIRLLIENGKLTPKESGWQHAYPEAELVAFWEQVINELESL